MKTTRSLLLWATLTGLMAVGDAMAHAEARLAQAAPRARFFQARRPQPVPARAPAARSNAQPPAPVARVGAAPAPIERRTATQPTTEPAAQSRSSESLGNRVEPRPQDQPASPTKAEAPRPLNPAERRETPTLSPNRAVRGGEHLSEWMNQHSTLSPSQQQAALDREPGFRELPAKTQQRLRDQLTQLNNMPPQQRAHWIARTEAMERLTPDQRNQVRGAMQQMAALPPEQRGPVQKSFRQLRELPPDQRMSALSSGRYTSQMNDTQRSTLSNLMRVEPMLEPPDPKQTAPR